MGELTMRRNLRDIIAKGLCSIELMNRHRDEYGSLRHTEPEKPCEHVCDKCWFTADHLLAYIEEHINDIQ